MTISTPPKYFLSFMLKYYLTNKKYWKANDGTSLYPLFYQPGEVFHLYPLSASLQGIK